MIVDFFDMVGDVLSKFTSILSYFGNVKTIMESVISEIGDYNVIGALEPYFGTIRYVAGDTVYMTVARFLQIGLFILLVRALYELVSMILLQLGAQKPLSWLKTFLKL
ncbi:MAG: hypothetical protein GX638_06965 [Crenarchaeota archaeon]|nr:hypothetical protein [Thermoproteota archaeon]